MQTPDELLRKLNQFEDVDSAIRIYREAGNIARMFKDVQGQALDCARSGMALDGVIHAKTESGSAGQYRKRPACARQSGCRPSARMTDSDGYKRQRIGPLLN